MASNFSILDASFDDWKQLVDLSTESDHWSFAYDDFSVYKKAFGEEKSRFLAAKGPDGDVFGFIGMGKLEANITTIGLHYVQPVHRGRGIGTQLFNEITKDSKEKGENICVYGIFNLSEKYASRRGFDKCAEWKLSIFNVNTADTSNIEGWAGRAGNIKLVNSSDVDVDKVAAFDRTLTTANIDRAQWIEAWLNHPSGWSKVALDANGSVIGYGTVRQVTLKNRLVVGPLYANNGNIAAALTKALLDGDKDIATRQIQFFAPNNQPTTDDIYNLCELLSGGNWEDLEVAGYFISQFTKQLVNVDIDKVVAVSDHALGFI